MNEAEATAITEQLSILKFFPSDPGARVAIMRMLQRLCKSYEQAQWLVDRAVDIFSEWPGPREIRALYCQKFPPSDGVSAYSNLYPDGFPQLREAGRKEIAGPEMLALPEGHIASADPQADAAVRIAMELMKLKARPVFSDPVTPKEISEAPHWLRKLEGYA